MTSHPKIAAAFCATLMLTSYAAGAQDTCAADHPPRAPQRDQPTAADRNRLQGCDSMSLYYGLDHPVNYKDARLCALIEFDGEPAWPTQGAGMLMMIYFNGDGVRRDRALAKQFACAQRGYEDDGLLEQLDKAAAKGARVEACDAANEFNSFNICAMLHEDLARRAARQQVQRRVASWDETRRAAFPALEHAHEQFTRARTPVDVVDLRGSTAVQFKYEADFENEFLAVLQALDGDDADASDLAARDRELNDTYRKVAHLLAPSDPDSADADDLLPRTRLRDAERRWLDYVGACETFRAATHSRLSADALRRLLIVQRTQALRGILVGRGAEEDSPP